MAFKFNNLCMIVVTFATAFTLSNCSGSNSASSKNTIGLAVNQDPLTYRFFMNAGSPTFYGYDTYANRINVVKSGDIQVQTSNVLSVPARTDSWFAGPAGKFYFAFEGRELFTLNPTDGAKTSIKTFAGTIKSVASDTDQGLYAFVDEYFSITLMIVSNEGQVLSQWTGGPVLGQGVVVAAGDILPSGQLLVVSDKATAALIDVKASIEKSTWTFKKLDLALSGMNWVAPISGSVDRALISDAKGIYLIDTQAGTTLDSVIPTGTFSVQKLGKPHLRYFDTPNNKWIFVSGTTGDTLLKQELPNASGANSQSAIEMVYLTNDYLNAITSATKDKQRRVLSVRFSDALVGFSEDVRTDSKIGFSDDAFISFDASPLGSIGITNLRTSTKESFKGFNRTILQEQRR